MTKRTENLKIVGHISKATDLELLSLKGVYKMWHVMGSDKVYIGSTSYVKQKGKQLGGFYTRWNSHLSELRRGINVSVGDLQAVVDRHGIGGIRFSIIEICKNREQCMERENFYLKNVNHLYNNYLDVRWRAYAVDMFDRYGKYHCSFDSITDAAKELKIDRASINNAILGNRPSAGGYLWAEKGATPIVPTRRCISKFTLEGEFLAEYETVEAIKNELGLTSTTAIRNAIKGKQKQAYGYKWIEAHPKEAKEKGWSESRLQTVKPTI